MKTIYEVTETSPNSIADDTALGYFATREGAIAFVEAKLAEEAERGITIANYYAGVAGDLAYRNYYLTNGWGYHIQEHKLGE